MGRFTGLKRDVEFFSSLLHAHSEAKSYDTSPPQQKLIQEQAIVPESTDKDIRRHNVKPERADWTERHHDTTVFFREELKQVHHLHCAPDKEIASLRPR